MKVLVGAFNKEKAPVRSFSGQCETSRMFVDSSSAEGSLSPVLRELEVPILSNGECEDLYRRAGHPQYIPDIFLCAGYRWQGRYAFKYYLTCVNSWKHYKKPNTICL